jgi:integrase
MTAVTLTRRRQRPYALDPLREVRHLNARAAREFADWLSWLEVSNKAPRTLDNYKRTIAALLIAFPDKEIGEFTDGDLLQLLREYPAKSRHLNRSHLNSFFRWARLTRRVAENPVDFLPEIKYHAPRDYDFFNDAEVDALCGLPAPDGQLMTLMLWTGMRRSECRCLTGKRLDFERQQVVIIEGAKNESHRKIPMLPRTLTAALELVSLEGIGRGDYVWYDSPGGHALRHDREVRHSVFGRWWERSVREAGVRYRKPHMTRHTFASKCYARGMTDKEVQRLLGHKDSRTTLQTYVHVRDEAVADRFLMLVGATE